MAGNLIEFVMRADNRSAIKAFTQLADASQKTRRKVSEDADKNSASFSRMGHSADRLRGSIGSLGGLIGFGGLAFGIKDAIQSSMSFGAEMTRLQTQAGASASQVRLMTGQVEQLAGQVGIGPQGLATGLYHIVSSMNSTLPVTQRASKEMSALKIAAEGARVGNANLEDVTNALGAAIASGLPGVQNYSQAMGALNATVGAGDMHMQDLAEALGTGMLGPLKRFGVSLKDVGAALAVFGDNNIRGADAGTKFISMIRIMAAPSGAAAKALAKIGMTPRQMADDIRSPGGLLSALKDLQSHLAGLDPTQQGMIVSEAFGGKQSTGVQLLLSQLDRFGEKGNAVASGMTGFGAAWRTTRKTPAQQMADFQAQMQALEITLGTRLLPMMVKMAQDASTIVGVFQKLPGPVQEGVLGLTALSIVLGPVRNSFWLLRDMVLGTRTVMGLFKGATEAATIAERVQAGSSVAGSAAAGGIGAAEVGAGAAGGLSAAGAGMAGLAALGGVAAGYGIGKLLPGSNVSARPGSRYTGYRETLVGRPALSAQAQGDPIQIHTHVSIDGREVAKAVTNEVIRKGARGPSSLVGGSLMAAR